MIMEYVFLALQVGFLICTIIFSVGDGDIYLVKKIMRTYTLVVISLQVILLITSVILLIIAKQYVVYVWFLDICLVGVLIEIFSVLGRIKSRAKIKEIIVNENLLHMESSRIRRYILEKHEIVCFPKDIEKAKRAILKAKN